MQEHNNDEKKDEYEKICFLCKRPESKTGKMVEMGGGICVCANCMQKDVSRKDARAAFGCSACYCGRDLSYRGRIYR